MPVLLNISSRMHINIQSNIASYHEAIAKGKVSVYGIGRLHMYILVLTVNIFQPRLF